MKIVHLVPSMESGGVEQVVMELGSGLSSRGVENIVVSGGGRLVPRLEKEGSRHILMPRSCVGRLLGMEKAPAGRPSRPRHQRSRLLLRQSVLRHHEPGREGDRRLQLHQGLHP